MRKIILLIAAVLLASCQHKGQFCVNGHVTDAADTVMYLEHISLGNGIEVVDSVRLDESGAFELKGDTMPTPEFYRLRIGGQCVNLAIDSTETVTVEASLKNMSFGYAVKGSGTCDTIRILSLKLADLERSIMRVAADRDYTVEERDAMIEDLVQQYKTEVKMDIIQNRYDATASYFACFQMLGGRLLFNPKADRSDLTWVRAVANAWTERYPGSQRAENLYNIVMEGQRLFAKPREIVIDANHSKVRELGIIDMTFPDIRGTERTLSDLKGRWCCLTSQPSASMVHPSAHFSFVSSMTATTAVASKFTRCVWILTGTSGPSAASSFPGPVCIARRVLRATY